VNSERKLLFLARGTIIYEYSVNGTPSREIDIAKGDEKLAGKGDKKLAGKRVSALGAFGRSFWSHKVSVVAGTRNGTIVTLENIGNETFRKSLVTRVSMSMIRSLVTDDDTGKVIVS
jgi:hypothetical protein